LKLSLILTTKNDPCIPDVPSFSLANQDLYNKLPKDVQNQIQNFVQDTYNSFVLALQKKANVPKDLRGPVWSTVSKKNFFYYECARQSGLLSPSP
jgi:hypothetical protein